MSPQGEIDVDHHMKSMQFPAKTVTTVSFPLCRTSKQTRLTLGRRMVVLDPANREVGWILNVEIFILSLFERDETGVFY